MENIVYRYGNRKMYSPLAGTYVVYEEILKIPNVKVVCHKTKLDITERVIRKAKLLQMIRENDEGIYT